MKLTLKEVSTMAARLNWLKCWLEEPKRQDGGEASNCVEDIRCILADAALREVLENGESR